MVGSSEFGDTASPAKTKHAKRRGNALLFPKGEKGAATGEKPVIHVLKSSMSLSLLLYSGGAL